MKDSRTFETVEIHGSERVQVASGSLAKCHARLGVIAGRDGLDLHVHDGEHWGDAAYSTAHKSGSDPMFYVSAFVRECRDQERPTSDLLHEASSVIEASGYRPDLSSELRKRAESIDSSN